MYQGGRHGQNRAPRRTHRPRASPTPGFAPANHRCAPLHSAGAHSPGRRRGIGEPGYCRDPQTAACHREQGARAVRHATLGRPGRRASFPGRKRKYGPETQARILAAQDAPQPKGYAQWNGPLLAAHLGGVPEHQVWRVLRHRSISLQRRRSWCLSTDPEFDRKAAAVVGL